MARYSKSEILKMQSDANQFRKWNINETETDFVEHSKKMALIILNEELTEKTEALLHLVL